ncbi:MAG: bifunctional folylpolyglutamate synthase/dihydrofolate synthase [Proteobacteria bacterium]|nr:bifunctional folylpolyglutamate synthase/dihydrofolate synthase [Pseudomonadota bacterium]
MDYRQSIAYLFGLQRFGIKLGLANIEKLLSLLGNPHKKLRCVHIAGTNGKGSTAAFLHSILTHSGYHAGLFTSPHLVDFTERIRIIDTEIPRKRVVQLVQQIRDTSTQAGLENITFFEFITALAFQYFAEEKTDPVVVETGMGGRLDATIAEEKAGIIKKNTPLLAGARQSGVIRLFAGKCQTLQAPFYVLGKNILCRKAGPGALNYSGLDVSLKNVQLGLLGDHQMRNAGLALGAAELLRRQGFDIQEQALIKGMQKARWPGRLEVVRQKPAVVLDGAHNPEAWKALRGALRKYFNFKNLFMVIGVMQDKDINRMIETLTPDAHTVIFCKPKMDRAAGKTAIASRMAALPKKKILWIEDTAKAVNKAFELAAPDDLLCVTGSLFTVGEAREYLLPGRHPASGRIPM